MQVTPTEFGRTTRLDLQTGNSYGVTSASGDSYGVKPAYVHLTINMSLLRSY